MKARDEEVSEASAGPYANYCTSVQTDNYSSTAHPTNNIKSLKALYVLVKTNRLLKTLNLPSVVQC